MSLRRLVLGTLLSAFHGPVEPDWARDLSVEGLAGYVLFGSNLVDIEQLTALTGSIRAGRSDILIAIDEEGGDVTRLWHHSGSPYPGNAALGAVDDPALTTAVYRAIGADLVAAGIDLDLAPSVDVNSAADNPVIGTRSFGADPKLVARHAAAAVAGLQASGVAACAKHFPGHGATVVDSHLELPVVSASLALLSMRDLPPFQAAASAMAQAVMTAHIRIPELTGELPATFSAAAIGMLREQIGYQGVVVTDALEMRGATRFANSVSGTDTHAQGVGAGAVLALMAGADLLCIGLDVNRDLVEQVVNDVINAVEDGRIPRSRLEDAADRVARLAAWTGASRRIKSNGVIRPDYSLGLEAAIRAIAIEGSLPDLSKALVIQLAATSTIAEGKVPWGLTPDAMKVPPDSNAEDILLASAGRPIVITGRNLSRLNGARDLIETLAATKDVVVVEMGWPSSWRPRGVSAFLRSYGASRANAAAAAEVLGLVT